MATPVPSEKVYRHRRDKFSIEALKARIEECWQKIFLQDIRKCILRFKMRLRAVKEQKGGHIEHLLK